MPGVPSSDGVTTAHAPQGRAVLRWKYLAQIAIVFVAQFGASKLADAVPNVNNGWIGPVWPASGIALSALILLGYSVWPGIAAGAFLHALLGPLPFWADVIYAFGTTLAVLVGAFLLRRINFRPSLSRLANVIGLIVFGAIGSAIVSASIGASTFYAAHVRGWSGFGSAWLVYWLGDSTGVLLVTPLVLTLPALFRIRDPKRQREFAALLVLLTAACFIVFGDLPLVPVRLHVLAFAVLPFVMWAAIRLGISATALSILLLATIATVETALGSGPFTTSNPLMNAVLLDIFFAVVSVTGLTLAAAISERELAERERERLVGERAETEARLRFAAIVESSEDAIISGTLDGIIVSWNAGAQNIYGYTESEAVGKPITILAPSELSDEENKILETLQARGRIEHFETTRVTKTGKKIDVSLTISPIKDSNGRTVGISGIARDITERKLSEKALGEMTGRLIEAQEQERARIGRELHDDITQRLAMLAVELEQLRHNPSEVQSRVEELRNRTTEISDDIQALSHELHSSKLEYLGLVGGMRSWCKEFGEQQMMEINFKSHDMPSLPKEVSLCLFRVLQEALNNAAKHSEVRRVDVQLWEDSSEIHLVISDLGKGFDVDAALQGSGLGLTSMKERVRLVNGTIAMDSRPMGGTTIHVRVPFGSEQASQRVAG